MAITGSQKAYTYALSNVLRSGAGRSGYVSGGVFISIGGVAHRGNVKYDSLSIVDNLDEAPNRCTFTLIDTTATLGQEVLITLGSTNGTRLFAGHVLTVDTGIGGKPDQLRAAVSCVDYSWQLGFLKVTERYTAMSATAIAADLIAKYAAINGFTSTGLEANLPSLTEITFTNEDLPDALTRLARRIGAYWYVDYRKAVHLFINPEVRDGDPTPLTMAHPTLAIEGFADTLDRSQTLTRVYVEGRGTTALGPVAVGDTMIPIETANMFAAASDVFVKVSFQGAEGAAQHLNFTGVSAGGVGSLVGPGAGPPGAPTLVVSTGAGLSVGTYQYAYTDVTPSGESLPSPLASVTTGVIAAPTTAPTPGPPTAGTGPDAGTHQYAVTFTTAAGETTPSVFSSVVTTGVASIPNPATAPIGSTPADDVFANLVENGLYKIKYAYATDAASPPANVTQASPASASIRANNSGGAANNAAIASSIPCSPSPAVNSVWFYRTTNGGSTFYRGSRTPNVPGTFVNYPGTPSDATIVTQGTEPVANTTPSLSVVPLSAIPLGGPTVTGRKLYRTAAGGTLLKLVATLGDNTTTTYTDTVADAALGAAAPTSNTATAAQVTVSNIAPGATPTTSRKVYRTVVNGAQLKLLTTLADNTTTTYLDALADASLGANAPTGDTSALQVPAGSVSAGATSLIAANVGVFPASGWAVIGNGEQVIRYASKSSTALLGIPSAGIGAITAAVAYNSTVTAAPMLTGIPASGVRSLSTRPLASGDELYLVVQVDDTARQTQLAATMGGNGVREEWVQDRRLSIAEARARGQATLSVRALSQDTLRYRCRDLRTAAGKSVTVSLGPPLNLNTVLKIQTVTIDNFRPHPEQPPTFTVEASSARFSFEDWLRKLRTKD